MKVLKHWNEFSDYNFIFNITVNEAAQQAFLITLNHTLQRRYLLRANISVYTGY